MAENTRAPDISSPPTGAPDDRAGRADIVRTTATLQRGRRTGVWSRFRQHRLALLGVAMLLILTVGAVGAPVISKYDPYSVDLSAYRTGPSAQHLLGTDSAGRDIFSRLLFAGRVSLSVGLVAVSIYTAIGILIGAVAGFYGGWVDSTLMRLTDIVLSFPSLIIIITLVSVLGPSIYNVMLAIGLLGWPGIARLLRGELLSLRERDFVTAARAIGVPNRRIIFRHLLPNALAPIIVAATLGIAGAILLEAALSFLGLGVQPPMPSWGNMLTDAQSLPVLESMPWLWLPPGIMIAIAVLSINFIGDGLRDALDPYLRR
jgi:peptide/nickel transport system permease protein